VGPAPRPSRARCRRYRVRGSLRFIAQALRREGRQTFHLHDLHVYASDRDREIRLFSIVLGCVSTVLTVLVAGSVAALITTPTTGLVAALATLYVFGHRPLSPPSRPTLRSAQPPVDADAAVRSAPDLGDASPAPDASSSPRWGGIARPGPERRWPGPG
jgi:hypothetical protein